mmetsp:Transcript_91837/g.213531  ORF Transcript_91837/g.213531 Transcript_91837/m.213531 type:complete len:206 (+) Transcript_91837:431-1048(+)
MHATVSRSSNPRSIKAHVPARLAPRRRPRHSQRLPLVRLERMRGPAVLHHLLARLHSSSVPNDGHCAVCGGASQRCAPLCRCPSYSLQRAVALQGDAVHCAPSARRGALAPNQGLAVRTCRGEQHAPRRWSPRDLVHGACVASEVRKEVGRFGFPQVPEPDVAIGRSCCKALAEEVQLRVVDHAAMRGVEVSQQPRHCCCSNTRT